MLFCYNDFYVLVLALASLAGCMTAAVQCVLRPSCNMYDGRHTRYTTTVAQCALCRKVRADST